MGKEENLGFHVTDSQYIFMMWKASGVRRSEPATVLAEDN
jgi:hypothetical protein